MPLALDLSSCDHGVNATHKYSAEDFAIFSADNLTQYGKLQWTSQCH